MQLKKLNSFDSGYDKQEFCENNPTLDVQNEENYAGRRADKVNSSLPPLSEENFQNQSKPPIFELPFYVREIVYQKLMTFHKTSDTTFLKRLTKKYLINILQHSKEEADHQLDKIFTFQLKLEEKIDYDDLVNFCMERHMGDIAIEKIWLGRFYTIRKKMLMSEDLFMENTRYALSFIHCEPTEEQLRLAFEGIHQKTENQCRSILYEDYFKFWTQCFGRQSQAAKLVNANSVRKELDIVARYSKYAITENTLPPKRLQNPQEKSADKGPLQFLQNNPSRLINLIRSVQTI